jgi:hypothetical protein
MALEGFLEASFAIGATSTTWTATGDVRTTGAFCDPLTPSVSGAAEVCHEED